MTESESQPDKPKKHEPNGRDVEKDAEKTARARFVGDVARELGRTKHGGTLRDLIVGGGEWIPTSTGRHWLPDASFGTVGLGGLGDLATYTVQSEREAKLEQEMRQPSTFSS